MRHKDNMLPVLYVLATTLQYQFNAATHLDYDVQVVFDGFIPILGGQDGVVDLKMVVAVDGLKPDAEGHARASSEIKEFKLVFNEAVLPLSVENVTGFFPKTTVSLTPEGKVVKTDAPDVQLPVRLPGLHVKRFPDITYVPIVFPTEPVEVGKSWTFTKAFGDSDVNYTVTPSAIDGSTVQLRIQLHQKYTVLEDESTNVVEEKDAVNRVTTVVSGDGEGVFDIKRGAMRSIEIRALASGVVEDLKSHAKTDRKLKTTLRTMLKTRS